MTFRDVEHRLLDHIRHRIRNGEATERGLARLAGVSQPHFHNVLKGRRSLSMDMADNILVSMGISILDLVRPGEVEDHHRSRSRAD